MKLQIGYDDFGSELLYKHTSQMVQRTFVT